jgi:predicted dehydrogenase
MAKFKSLIVGSGQIGAFFDTPRSKDVLTHAHGYFLNKNFDLVGFVDKDINKARKAAGIWGGQGYGTLREAFDKNGAIDVVSLCLPDQFHFQYLQEVAKEKVKLVFAEKPLTLKLDQAEKIVKLYERNKIPLLVNYSRRFVPEIAKIATKIKENQFGKFLTGSGYYGKGLLHNGTHMIDLVRMLLGEISSVRCGDKLYDFTREDPSWSAELKIKSGGSVGLRAVDSRAFSLFELDLVFSKSRIRLVESGNKIEIYKTCESDKFKGYKYLAKPEIINTSLNRSLFFAVDNISSTLVKKGKPTCNARQAFVDMEIAEKIKNSKCLN